MTAASLPTVCLRCGRTRPNHGRRLCHFCYNTAWRDGSLADYDRDRWAGADLLAEYQHLRGGGLNHVDAAARLARKPKSIKRAMNRARARQG